MRFALLAVLAACGTSGGHPTMDLSTSFQVTDFTGNGPSPLDPLQNQTIDFSVHWDGTDYNNGDGSDPQGCKSLAIGYGFGVTTRTAHGATAQLVQSQILDRLDNWDIVLQLCDAAGASTVSVDATIDALNLSFGCFGVPATAMKKNAQGFPELTSFTATQCSATILDVANNRDLGADNFSMKIDLSASQLP